MLKTGGAISDLLSQDQCSRKDCLHVAQYIPKVQICSCFSETREEANGSRTCALPHTLSATHASQLNVPQDVSSFISQFTSSHFLQAALPGRSALHLPLCYKLRRLSTQRQLAQARQHSQVEGPSKQARARGSVGRVYCFRPILLATYDSISTTTIWLIAPVDVKLAGRDAQATKGGAESTRSSQKRGFRPE